MSSFSPDRVIDRHDEQEAFKALLAPDDESRLMTIRDQGRAGKSELLALLRWLCGKEDPSVPACLVALDQLQPQTPYILVRALEKSLRGAGLEFPRFKRWEDARLDRALAGGIKIEVTAGEIKDDASVTALNVGGDINIGGTTDVDELLKERAVDAFLEDLRHEHAHCPIVILFDAYEKCGKDLREWIPAFLLKPVLDSAPVVDRLAIVIAGREVPEDDLRSMLKERFDRLVRPFPSLSCLEREHVRTLIELNGVVPGEADVDYLYNKLREDGWAIGLIVQLLEQYPGRAGQ